MRQLVVGELLMKEPKQSDPSSLVMELQVRKLLLTTSRVLDLCKKTGSLH